MADEGQACPPKEQARPKTLLERLAEAVERAERINTRRARPRREQEERQAA